MEIYENNSVSSGPKGSLLISFCWTLLFSPALNVREMRPYRNAELIEWPTPLKYSAFKSLSEGKEQKYNYRRNCVLEKAESLIRKGLYEKGRNGWLDFYISTKNCTILKLLFLNNWEKNNRGEWNNEQILRQWATFYEFIIIYCNSYQRKIFGNDIPLKRFFTAATEVLLQKMFTSATKVTLKKFFATIPESH